MKRIQSLSNKVLVCFLFGLLLSLSQLSSTIQAQSTADVCRQTREVIDQIIREERDLSTLVYVKNNEEKVRDDYAHLNRDISNGIYRTADQLTEDGRGFGVEEPKDSSGSFKPPVAWTPQERTAVQIAIRNAMAKELAAAAKTTSADLKYQFGRLVQQKETREKRWSDLHCDDVLAREESSSDNNSLAGTWEGTAGDGRFREIWTISGSGETWTVSGRYLDMKTGSQKGAFSAQNVHFKDGTLSFHQVFSPKPDDGWADSNDISEVTASGDTLSFRHKWGSVTLKRKK